ncbi:MAG: hypothetical protein DMG58_16665 [Acidobacteria bacterium]|nr:MAG: hypothetical protein DMG58_16665 [Acidobacteriota bacterium]
MKDSHQKAAEDHNLAAHAQRTAAALTQEVDNKSGRETGALASPVCGAGDSSHTPGLIRRATLPIGFVFVFAAVAFGQHGNWYKPVAASPNPTFGRYNTASVLLKSGKPAPKASFVSSTAQVFPHIATGGGWETVVVIVNMSVTPVDFTASFYDEAGAPMQVTFSEFPSGHITTTSAIDGHLGSEGSFNFSLFDATSNTQVGWVMLDYDTSSHRIGGYSAFRYRAGGVINEGLVPISGYDDTRFYMSFDNIEGFATGIALTNPSTSANVVTIAALDLDGNEITGGHLTLPAGGHHSFVLADSFPALAGRTGTLYVSSNQAMLSAVGIRMNVAGGYTFTSIPVMNWEGMF